MRPLAERQRGFAAALLDAALPMPQGLVGPDGEPSPKRFAVYRNNVVVGLTETLKDAFPAVRRIVGPEFFQAMARAYVVLEPPRSPILLDYGAGFPDFIGPFEPAAVLPYLADVARIERAWAEAYHAPEAPPIDPAAFPARAASRDPSAPPPFEPSGLVAISSTHDLEDECRGWYPDAGGSRRRRRGRARGPPSGGCRSSPDLSGQLQFHPNAGRRSVGPRRHEGGACGRLPVRADGQSYRSYASGCAGRL